MKRCTKCGISKPLSEFAVDRAKADGRDSWCRNDRNAARRQRYRTNLGHEQQRSRDYYQENRVGSYDPALQHQRYLAWKARNPDGLWAQWLKAAHGMRPEQWFVMWDQQAGRCYLCEQELPDDRSKVAIDHDHSHCGKKRSCPHCRRGLAHSVCNMLLGMFGEDVALMRRTFASFVANFERTQAQAQALMAVAPIQDDLFGDGDAMVEETG